MMADLVAHPATTIARCALQSFRQLRLRPRRASGPLGAPFDQFSPATIADPAAAYRRLHARPGVHPAGRQAFALAGYDDVRAGARAHDVLVSGLGVTVVPASLPMLLTLDRPRHDELRRLLTPAFTARHCAALEPMMRELTRSAIERMLAYPSMDAVAELAVPLPITVIARLLGIPEADLDRFHRWSDGIVEGFHSGPGRPARSVVSVLALYRYLVKVFARLRGQPGEDVISTLLSSQDGGSLRDGELFWVSLMLLVAGNETTTNLIGSLLLALAHNPETYERLRAHPELIDAAIEEAVRWGSPIQHLYRTAAADYAVGSTTIPAGARVLLLFGAANRDPRKFPHPDRFDIDRKPSDQLGFGAGIHYCLGARLARLEARVVLEELISRVTRIRLDGPIAWRTNPTVHGPSRLPLSLEAA